MYEEGSFLCFFITQCHLHWESLFCHNGRNPGRRGFPLSKVGRHSGDSWRPQGSITDPQTCSVAGHQGVLLAGRQTLGLVTLPNAPVPRPAWGLLRGHLKPVYPDFSSLELSLMGHQSLLLSGRPDLAACSVITLGPGDGGGTPSSRACSFKGSWFPSDSSPQAHLRGLCGGLRGV